MSAQVLFTRSHAIGSLLLRTALWSPWSHCALVDGDTVIEAAAFGGVFTCNANKAELSVGYATLYGDMAGGFAPLKDVPKTLVYRLAEWRNRSAPVIPRRVIERAPSAELAPDQTDQDSLPPYPVLDAILELYVEQDRCPEDIVAAGFDAATVARVVRMVNRNEYKRRQAAPGVRISRRAFGRDRRYPITSGYA